MRTQADAEANKANTTIATDKETPPPTRYPISWDGPNDSGSPQNLPPWRKWLVTLVYGLITFNVTFASSIFSTATEATAQEFGVSKVVTTLATSLTVLGFAFGPLIFGPMSEVLGRKIPLLSGFFVFTIFNIPVAVAHNLETILVCRFIVGFGGAATLAIVGGALADMFPPVERGSAVCFFAAATFLGPLAGPIVGGFVTMSHLGWRWTQWLTLILAAVLLVVTIVAVPETYGPVLLQRRARRLRLETRDWAIHAALDEEQMDAHRILNTYALRPLKMLLQEPILASVTLYMSVVYGVLYLFLEAYPVSFGEQRGWNLGVATLPFLSLGVGIIIGALIIVVHNNTRFARHIVTTGKPNPEERLVPMMLGAVLLPCGLFWFAWTSSPHITWVPQVLSGIPIGAGLITIFLQGLNYIIDVYTRNANSAVSANVFLRSWVGAAFPLFATGMYHNLGVAWATSLLGFICVALAPVPVLFYVCGKRIRGKSKFVPS